MACGGVLSDMTIGLICALPQELDHLRQALTTSRRDVVAGVDFHSGRLDGHDCVLAGSGMGKVNAAVVATSMADRFKCRAIVFAGVAGGLDPALDIGDVVIADETLQHDAGLIERGTLQTYQAGHVPTINPTDQLGYRTNAELLERVAQRLDGVDLPVMSAAAGGTGRPVQIRYGTVVTGDQFVQCTATRDRLREQFGGSAIEMEGAAVAQVCESFGVPWLIIRTLSDLAGSESLLDFGVFAEEVAVTSAAILRLVLPVL
jgi:adenosylhomocysteine nucleosidase